MLHGAAEVGVYDNFVSQPRPRDMEALRDFRRSHAAARSGSFRLWEAIDALPADFDPEDLGVCAVNCDHLLRISSDSHCPHYEVNRIHADAPAVGISVKAGSDITVEADGKSYLKINLGGTAHKRLAPGVHRLRNILDDSHDGPLVGLLQSDLPSEGGTHADSMLLYVVSTALGAPIALLSKVPLQELEDHIPHECLHTCALKLPLDLEDEVWPKLLDKAFVRVECTPLAP